MSAATGTMLGKAPCPCCNCTVDVVHDEARCPRCSARVRMRMPDSLQRTVALLIAASILYVPANLLPIMTTDQFGRSVDSTIVGGVVLLWNMGSYPVALVILIEARVV